jgi:mono/diheme cytochrome c family protein
MTFMSKMIFLLSDSRRTNRWGTTALAACTLGALLGCGGAQRTSAAPPPPAPVAAPSPPVASPPAAAAPTAELTTMVGVFTIEQASRGKDVYAGTCKSCHTTSDQSGVPFDARWRGKLVSDLFTYVGTKMPQDNPGSLDPGQTADVIAYLLLLNAMPAGSAELPPDLDSLAHIRIDHRRPGGLTYRKTATRTKS